MPVSPEQTAELVKGLVEIYTESESTLLRMVAERLERGIDTPDWAERKLAELGRLRQGALAELDRLRRAGADEIDDAIRIAYNRGSALAATDLERVAGQLPEIAFGRVDDRAIEALVAEAVEGAEATHLRILRSVVDVYRDTVAQAGGQVLTGTQTRRQAAQLVLDRFASRGVTGFVDKAGRSWNLASYAEMSLRTSVGRAAIQGHTERLLANGRDLVIVSDAPQECKKCRPWEGKVLSISGTTTGTLEDGTRVAGSMSEAVSDGLFHANCRHRTAIYLPGVTRPMHDTEDPDGDRDRQELRRLERGVREWRRRSAVALDEPARKAADAKAREWQAKIRTHVDTTSAKRQPQRERLGAR
jgi:hypothetical protein